MGSTECCFFTLSGVLDAALQDGYTHASYRVYKGAVNKLYRVSIPTARALSREERYRGINPGIWWYSFATGSIRSKDNKIILLLHPYSSL